MVDSTANANLTARLTLLGPYWPAALLVLIQLTVYPSTGGAWMLGLVTGLLTALLALGLALVYRANRILNFAQGDLGTVPTMVAVGLITVTGLPYLVGVTLGLAAALVLGVLVDLVVIGRFAKAPRLLLTVATIGLSQLLIVSGLLLPRLWGLDIFAQQSIPDPFTARFNIGTQTFGGSEITALVLAPLLLLVLAIWLRSTDIGVAVRASADGADRAALLGIPVRRLQTVVWAVAAVLSFVGVFLHASIFGVGGAAALSPQVLVFALGALVLGRLEHFPAVAASAVALRILAAGIDANNPSAPGRVYVVLAVVGWACSCSAGAQPGGSPMPRRRGPLPGRSVPSRRSCSACPSSATGGARSSCCWSWPLLRFPWRSAPVTS